MIKKILLKAWIILCIIGLVIVFFWLKDKIPLPENITKLAINAYYNETYSAIIVDKFIDKDQHNSKKIILKGDRENRTILFDIETSGVYYSLQVGDSIVKHSGSLEIMIYKEGNKSKSLFLEFNP